MALRIAEKFSIDRYALEKELKYYHLNSHELHSLIDPDSGIDFDDLEIEVDSYTVRYKGDLIT